MVRIVALFCPLVVAVLLSGCSSKPAPQPSAKQPAQGPAHDHDHDHAGHDHEHAQAAPHVPADTTPENVIHHFLDALREGDEGVASYLLTSKARAETAKHDLVVSPPGTPAAQYEVRGAEFMDDSKGAYVTSVWTEPDQSGAAQSYEIVWVMRRQADGWRVAGMATQIIAGDMPLFLNFEDPQDMLRKREQALAELAERHTQQPAAQQAQLPETQPTSR